MCSVPEEMIRCDQTGDWSYSDYSITAFVSEKCCPESQLAILIHELVEAYLCKRDAIKESEVCDFDEMFEKERKSGLHKETEEPGDDPRAPYREQHMAATHVERAVCAALDILWVSHEQEIK